MNAKGEILQRVRTALADRPGPVSVPRDYRQHGSAGQPEDVALFAERVADYRATVHRCATDAVATRITAILAERGLGRVVVPDGFPGDWTPTVDVVNDLVDTATLDEVGAVVSTCAVAIAETGTIVLDAGPGMGPRALTLVPDYHLAVVTADRIHRLVGDALAALPDPTRPITMISGPSATSDIELDRVEGVHGPRTLDVLIVG